MAEVRVKAEGELWWVQASGSGRTWATASAPSSGQYAYVESFTYTSARRIFTVADRGIPDHHKHVGTDPINLTLNYLWTGGAPSAASGSGASFPMVHLEYRASAKETPTTGVYYQFHGVPLHSLQWTENENGNAMNLPLMALAMNGPTASGYIK